MMKASKNRRWRYAARRLSRRLPAIGRSLAVIVVFFLAVFAAFRVAAPFLISTGLVRNGIENAVSKWTGYEAEIAGTPVLEFWPTPRITLNQVTIRQPAEAGGKVFGHIDSLSAEFSLLDAVRGRANFHEFHFNRPSFYLKREANGLIDWTDEGLLARAIVSATTDANHRQTLPAGLDAEIGAVTVEDGSVQLTDVATGTVYAADSLSADIVWPRLSAPMAGVVLARINGEDTKFDLSSSEPLLLFAGKTADAKATLTSRLANFSFEGTASILTLSSISGHIDAKVPDMPGLIKWSGRNLPDMTALTSMSLKANMLTVANGLRFNDVNLTLNDASATGIMDFNAVPGKMPKITGTLAFDELNLAPLLAAFSLRVAAGGDPADDGNILHRLALDLRLSADKATLSPFQLQDVGASLLVSDGSAKFDIGDSQFQGGTLNAHLEATEGDFDGGGKLRISIRDADFSSLAEALNLDGPLPLATGSLDLSLSTETPIWTVKPGNLAGKVHFYANAGSVRQFNASVFRTLTAQKSYFPLRAAEGGRFDFDKIDLQADIEDGAADIQSFTIAGPHQTLTLSGVVALGTKGLALSGALDATDPAESADLPLLPFFVGGSWPDPVISPVPDLKANTGQ